MDEKDWHNLLYVPRKKGKGKDKGGRDMNLKEIKALATEQFGDPTKIDKSRVQASASDHCNGAQDALRRFAGIAKTEANLKQQYGSEWYGTKNKHGHMMQHVRTILAMIDSGFIKKSCAPNMPEMEDRPRTGDAVLCERTKEGHEMTQKRQKYWHDVMMKAELDPEKYSRWVRIPPQDADLVGKKIEMRIQFETDVFDDNGKVTGTEAFLHCFEGTVTGVRVNENGNLRSVLGTRSKWAVATIAWDVEFLAWGAESHHGLNPSLYANEKKNGGWNILNERYAAMACAADKFEEVVQELKQKQHGGDIDIHAAVAMSE